MPTNRFHSQGAKVLKSVLWVSLGLALEQQQETEREREREREVETLLACFNLQH